MWGEYDTPGWCRVGVGLEIRNTRSKQLQRVLAEEHTWRRFLEHVLSPKRRLLLRPGRCLSQTLYVCLRRYTVYCFVSMHLDWWLRIVFIDRFKQATKH